MNSVKIVQSLKQTLIDYLMTTFDANKDGKEPELAHKIRESFEYPNALFTGPYLELIHPYLKGASISDLVHQGILSEKLLELPSFNLPKPEPIPPNAPLFSHQIKAIHKLVLENRSIVISSGTGSGKTECFSIPIVNDLLNDDTRGVRALLVYPLNALVNDQMERLRIMLNGTDITFGRFTSELPNQMKRDGRFLPNEIISREEIRKEGKLPQILITNYAMLEYLLVRPEDSRLFDSGLWKYIVLDEAHTYTGAQGIEVAMLIRRLKQRLGKKPGEILCIATSATLTNDNLKVAAEFAQKLFCENFQENDVIFGEEEKDKLNQSEQKTISISHDTLLKPDLEVLLNEIQELSINEVGQNKKKSDIDEIALRLAEIGLIDNNDLNDSDQYKDDLTGFLFSILSKSAEFVKLRNWMIQKNHPVLFGEAARYMFPQLDNLEQSKALFNLIELGAFARPGPSLLPLLPIKYHLFVRPPQGCWVCLNPVCKGKDPNIKPKWSRIYSNPINKCESCGAQVYPIHLCRECGQAYISTYFEISTSKYLPEIEQNANHFEKRYFTWSRIEENIVLAEKFDEDTTEEDDQDLLSFSEKYQQNSLKICLNCGTVVQNCSCGNKIPSIALFDIQERRIKKRKNEKGIQFRPINNLQECPRCRSKAKDETEIVTPISVRAIGPLSNLIYELYRQLPVANDLKMKSLPGEGRKLLTFYDSRQGAARFAAHLQDVSNKQNYRHIIPLAINQCLQINEWGNSNAPNLIDLSRKCGEIAWEKGIIQNDPDSEYWRKITKSLTSDQRDNAALRMAKIILGEFTTGRRSRQSLESMGLVGVSYFQPDENPDFAGLAKMIGLSTEQTQALLGHLLDDLRFRKAIRLLREISPDDPVFGPNVSNPRIIRQGNRGYGEDLWIGKTHRQYRRQYIQRILSINNLDASENNVITTLTHIWDWMINETNGLFNGSATEGYQLDPIHIFFDTRMEWYRCNICQRLSNRGTSLPCPYPNCYGKFERIEITTTQKHNYFYNLFTQPLIPIRVEEHSGQLDSEKGKDYQSNYKKGFINVLSCSTTFEMGIDLGDLQAVAMNNVPPTVANYRQRAGRAGRRTNGTAFILTWASDRPHDQAYYDTPIEIISGRVAIPNISLENELILRRHVNALLLGQFLLYRKNKGIKIEKLTFSGNFFDINQPDEPHLLFINDWIKENFGEIKNQLYEYAISVPENTQHVVKNGIENFVTDLQRLNDEHYQPITIHYRNQIRQLANQLIDSSINNRLNRNIPNQIKYYQNLLDRMRGSTEIKSGYLIDYLSSNGVLPSYSFPLHTVELLLPKEIKSSEHLRLERDLRIAIKEYAPGSEIVADKKIWKSLRPLFWKDTPKLLEYRICERCHHLEISNEAGISLPVTDGSCPVCKMPYGSKSRTRKFVEPDGFIADPTSGKPAKQFVRFEPNQMRSALIPEFNLEEEEFNKFISLEYNQKGKLLYVNEGNFGNGFTFPIQAFAFHSEDGRKEKCSLGHIQTTNTLHIRFIGYEYLQIPPPDDQSFWLTLLYAIIHGASHCLQIERRDIDGVLVPRSLGGSWEQTIVLYDNVPGGAGHVKNIREHLLQVLEEAQRVLNCNDCAPDTSCYHCLKDYNNQYFHHLLKRETAQKFLDNLIASIKPLEINIPGLVRIVVSDSASWLLEKIRYAKQSVKIAIPKLDFRHPMGENYTWLDTFGDLLNKGCQVCLYLQDLPKHSPEGYSLGAHLQVLMNKGLKLWKIEHLPDWQIIIDGAYPEPRIIKAENKNDTIVLEDQIGTNQLLSTTSLEAVKTIIDLWKKIKRIEVRADELNPPHNIQVINIKTLPTQKVNEQVFFSKFFTKPSIKMRVHDPYLFDRERIVNRLGNYILMASQHNTLKEVLVQTKKASDFIEQEKAEQELSNKYKGLVRFKHNAEHDRYIEVTRSNGEQARIILGRGLDFIQPDGSTKSTFIVIQDPIESKK